MIGRASVLAAVLAATLFVAVPATGRPPILTLPPDIAAEAQGPSGAVVTYTVSARHPQSGRPVPVTCDRPSGSTFPLGETTVTCVAGNPDDPEERAIGRFKVTVRDTTPPALSVPGELRVEIRTADVAAAYPPIAQFLGAARATDLVDPSPVVRHSAPDRLVPGRTIVTFTATDRFGNATSATSAVTVVRIVTRAKKARRARSALFAPAAGARVAAPPVLRWRAVARATYYNVQLYRRGKKILSRWPSRARLPLRRAWTFNGRRIRLTPGVYRWWVWPGYGSRAAARYGRVLGQSTFRVVG